MKGTNEEGMGRGMDGGREEASLLVARSYTSSSDSPISLMSSFTLSNHLLLGLPLFLLPCTFITIALLPSSCSSLLITCPCHFNLLSCIFFVISPTFVVPLILSFLILFSFEPPHIHRSILISATSNFFSCAFFNAHVSAPYISAGLATVLHTFPIDLHAHSPVAQHSRHSLPVLPPALHSVGDFRIQFSIHRQRRSQVCKCLHSLYCLSLLLDLCILMFIAPQVFSLASTDLQSSLSITLLHSSSFLSTWSLPVLHSKISSANSIHQGAAL